MKKILLVLTIVCFSITAYAQDNSSMGSDSNEAVYVTNQYIENTNIFVTKTQNWLLLSLGGMVPSRSAYDSYFTFGITAGGQFSRFFATEINIDYMHWQEDRGDGTVFQFDTADLKTYLLFQPVFTIKNTVSLLPHFGLAPLYSFHEENSEYNTFGYAMKIGLRVNYKYMMGGFKVEYAQRNLQRTSTTYAAEIGVTF